MDIGVELQQKNLLILSKLLLQKHDRNTKTEAVNTHNSSRTKATGRWKGGWGGGG